MLSKNDKYRSAIRARYSGDLITCRALLMQCIESEYEPIWKAFFTRSIAESYIDSGDLDKAAEYFVMAVAIDPSPLSLLKQASFFGVELQDRERAARLCELAVEKARSFSDSEFSFPAFEKSVRNLVDRLAEK